ncbi:hypothetical protein [uncultured Streptomyces sp.]|nr:hypothetical protein [uncultured Streptomyces sp.]
MSTFAAAFDNNDPIGTVVILLIGVATLVTMAVRGLRRRSGKM